ncbi:MAG: YafY family protein [Pseudomonadota bacterium]
MRRTDRLFELIQLFREGRLWRGQDLADRLEVSVRTIYRDIDTLIASGVPIEGERGVGYLLRAPIFLPPLTLSSEELEALYLGVEQVRRAGDPALSRAATALRGKIDAVVAEVRRAEAGQSAVSILSPVPEMEQTHLPLLRQAIRDRALVAIEYLSLQDEVSSRVVWPLNLQYWGTTWTFVAWCELRGDFRVFRADRIQRAETGIGTFPDQPGKTYADFIVQVEARDGDKFRPPGVLPP